MSVTCELSRTAGYDPTGENQVLCGAPADYCEVCEVNVCADCHAAIATQVCLPLKKGPGRAAMGSDRKSGLQA